MRLSPFKSLVAVAGCLLSVSAQGQTVFNGSGVNSATGSTLGAKVTFTSLSSGSMQITLQNMGSAAIAPSDILSAVFFNVSSSPTFTPTSAMIAPGSFLWNAPATYDVGKEWALATGSGPHSTSYGIGSAGFGYFGAGNFSAGGNPTDGLNYGIINGKSASANSAVQTGILVDDTMKFTLNVPTNFTLDKISNVWFQYGTSLSEPSFQGVKQAAVPEPGPVAMLVGGGFAAATLVFRRRRTVVKA